MATKKTKNAKNAAEYIDSAGVKLNANSDLIIEANKDGDVISARNLINGNEYVGGGSSSGALITITDDVSDISYNDLVAKAESGVLPYFIAHIGASNSPFAAFRLTQYIISNAGYTATFTGVVEVDPDSNAILGVEKYLLAQNGTDMMAIFEP